MSLPEKRLYEFGPYRLNPQEHVLVRAGEIIPLTPKALDLLIALVKQNGHVLTKDELMKQVWPDSFVEEANLSHHVFTLRKALEDDRNGARYIKTIPRRGYRFVADVTEIQDEPVELLVKEHIRSQVVIEEVTETSGAAELETVAAEPTHTLQAVLPKRRPAVPALLMVSLLAAGGAGFFPWRIFFAGHQAATPALKMKITRLTSAAKAIASISPDGRFICYIQNHFDGLGALWLRQVGTNQEIQLIEPGERVFYGTAFSPDGQFIYYSAADRHDTEGALFRVPVLGGPPARLLGQFGSQFSLSPDGQQAAFYRYAANGKQRSMRIAALDGSSEQTLLTFNCAEKIFSGNPAWSPDNQRLAFAVTTGPGRKSPNGDRSLFTLDLTSRELSSLTTELWREIGRQAWSSDGQTLYFVAGRPRIGNQLYYLDYPSGALHQLTSGVQGYGNYGLGITADGNALVADGWETSFQLWTVTADGHVGNANRLTTGLDDGSTGLTTLTDGRIVYVARTGDDLDLWTMKPDGTEAKPLTADAYAEHDVTATLDGRYLVFVSNRAGRNHLFRLDADGSNLKQLTFGDSTDATPDCSPDGAWVVYTTRSGDKSTLWKVPLEGGTPQQLTDYQAIEPSFSPDGKFISCILPNSSKVERGSLAILSADGGPPNQTFPVVQFAHYYVTPRWSPAGQAILYTEKQNGVGNLWKQPLAGGSPQQLTDFKTDIISNFAFSRDGKNIVLARGPKGAYVVLIRDFK
jgi:Tol biopolymer transport system component/DNA-binding winged helix-turn-helix (wHTH) protein